MTHSLASIVLLLLPQTSAAASAAVPFSIPPQVQAALIAIAASLIGVAFSELRHKRAAERENLEDLQGRVEREVKALFGEIFKEIRETDQHIREQLSTMQASRESLVGQQQELEERAKAQLQSLSESVGASRDEIGQTLSKAEAALAQLQSQLSEYTRVIPALQRMRPMELLAQAHRTRDPNEARLIVQTLLETDADSVVMESAADFARDQIDDPRLAIQLYGAALKKTPENVRLQAEIVYTRGSIEGFGEAILVELERLVEASPENFVFNALVNACIRNQDYPRLKEICIRTISKGKPGLMSLAHRNLAVSLERLKASREEIVSEYEAALLDADGGDYVNGARAYSGYLLDQEDVEHAHRVISRALTMAPRNSQLVSQAARVFQMKGEFDRAVATYEFALTTTVNSTELLAANRRLEDLRQLMELRKRDIILPDSNAD